MSSTFRATLREDAARSLPSSRPSQRKLAASSPHSSDAARTCSSALTLMSDAASEERRSSTFCAFFENFAPSSFMPTTPSFDIFDIPMFPLLIFDPPCILDIRLDS
ncbi:hypothetical protein L227DRAFT_608196 [Lentinus tigrinus ALCF2SS1-6]|uniref:Uncharacterized protein n=1 Tax=Lentinus tigrinus ALCF2SS1-6 TaxID=1328759 RepID=A0A5C2SJ49_9APHY|nr:hypothetical protein L227DRAFT_608196 [Lentinus tigrinus ALCF2SS1-6]